MKTLLTLLLAAGALVVGATPTPVGATRGPQPAGLVPHGAAAASRALTPLAPRTDGAAYTCGSSCATYEAGINRYFTDVAAADGATNNVYSVGTQYYDTIGGGQNHVTYGETFGGSVEDTSAYPASLCNDSYHGHQDAVCLTDTQVRAEVTKEIAANNWPTGTSNLFFVFTPNDVGICFDNFGVNGQGCSTNVFCAYHDYISPPGIVYAVEPDNATIPTGGCDPGQEPNANGTDPTINTVSHEQNEAITDPTTTNGWFSGQNEIGDLCAWGFGATQGPLGAEYNQTINGHSYYLQQEYSNSDGGCVQHLGGPHSAPTSGSGPLNYSGGPVMRTNTVYAIYWIPSGSTGPSAPASIAPPIVSGVAAVGQTLTTTNGSWSGSPTSYAYQWQSCSAVGTSCLDIAGATGGTYTPTAGDAGHEIRAEVSATNAGGSSGFVSSTPTEVVVPAPVVTIAPVVSGVAAVGKTLSTTQGTWNTPVAYTYAWLRCSATGTACASISGANASTYTVAAADLGHELEAQVSATNAAATTSALSGLTAEVVGVPAASRLPAISGKASVGKRLSVNTGTWSGSPSSFRYQWLRCGAGGGSCVRIQGATKPIYRVTKRDAHHRLRVQVTAVNDAGTSRTTSGTTRTIKS